jgi:pSer/pThr/pTyr-binding forkhead associated (FHA) protein
MAIRLTIRDRRATETEFTRTFIDHRILIGRSRTCHVCLPDLYVSAVHLEIRLDGTGYCAVDQGGLNGTRIGGRTLIARRPAGLSNGDVIRIAHYEITFALGVSAEGMPDRNLSEEQARSMLAAILANRELPVSPALIVVAGPGKASRFELGTPPLRASVGSARDDIIRLPDRAVFRHHAEVICETDEVVVRDNGGRGGIAVNGAKVKEAVLSFGDSFTVGNTTLMLEHPLEPILAAIQRAPEEETSSFTPDAEEEDRERTSVPPAVAESPGSPTLPVGPPDPLEAVRTEDYVKTQEFPIPADERRSGDTGLIIVGAILVVLCVAGLLWLFS